MSKELLRSLLDLSDMVSRSSITDRFHFLQENDLSHSQMMSLVFLDRNEQVSINTISKHLGITNAAVSQFIDRMEKNGLVVRTPNPQDRRIKLLELTDKGREVVKLARQSHHRWITQLVASLDPEELPLIEKSIKIILAKLP
ncbi:MAG: MarR family transcriptional regulator, partial [Anaerolineaceae bacterium]|nr:MarR family transcriptional regulator [Anaerolineaceae bacterium]